MVDIDIPSGTGTKENPWKLQTPPKTSEYEMYIDEKGGNKIIVCTVGKTVLHYDFKLFQIFMKCLKNIMTGNYWVAQTNKSQLKKVL